MVRSLNSEIQFEFRSATTGVALGKLCCSFFIWKIIVTSRGLMNIKQDHLCGVLNSTWYTLSTRKVIVIFTIPCILHEARLPPKNFESGKWFLIREPSNYPYAACCNTCYWTRQRSVEDQLRPRHSSFKCWCHQSLMPFCLILPHPPVCKTGRGTKSEYQNQQVPTEFLLNLSLVWREKRAATHSQVFSRSVLNRASWIE